MPEVLRANDDALWQDIRPARVDGEWFVGGSWRMCRSHCQIQYCVHWPCLACIVMRYRRGTTIFTSAWTISLSFLFNTALTESD